MGKMGTLITESNNPRTVNLSRASTKEMLEMINREDQTVANAVREQIDMIAKAVDIAADRLAKGGRMFYFGAGTSGRLGIIDASECNPTFGVAQETVQGIIAGGYDAIINASLGNEDSYKDGTYEIQKHRIGEMDVVIGIAASGRTPYVLGVLDSANQVGAATIGICNNPDTELHKIASITIAPITGPEVVQGSTRMKAGTSQKMVLNMISTGTMVKLGKVYKNLMVDLVASNEKLYDRAQRIVAAAADVDQASAKAALQACGYEVKTAITMILYTVSAEEARAMLSACAGYLDRLDEVSRNEMLHRN